MKLDKNGQQKVSVCKLGVSASITHRHRSIYTVF